MTNNELPSTDNLAVCPDHEIMTHARDEKRLCALCVLDSDIDVRRDDNMAGKSVIQQEVRQRLEAETLVELLPLMDEYVTDAFDGDVWMTVERFEGKLPAGYSEAQERWINVVGYTTSNMKKYITTDPNARETIETLKENGYSTTE